MEFVVTALAVFAVFHSMNGFLTRTRVARLEKEMREVRHELNLATDKE